VSGIAIANKSQKFLARIILPLSLVCTNSVEKKFYSKSVMILAVIRLSITYGNDCERQVNQGDYCQDFYSGSILGTSFLFLKLA